MATDDIATRALAALSGKALVDTASGMLAATAGLTSHEAARYLRAYAARRGRGPAEIAEQLVRRTVRPEAVLADAAERR
ncbi:ANTAR domain-containing protein [Streptomyces sp. NPDC005409]|uniref:ANTAR domain-containing protein n=1 Tax=Streptomyces sp. NPDC005409 TaxID=3155342 RepID=UPI0034571EFA